MTSLFKQLKKEDKSLRRKANAKINKRFNLRQSKDPEKKAMMMLQAKNFARSLVLVSGLKNFTLEYAHCQEVGHAYADRKTRKIVLGSHIIDIIPYEVYTQVIAGVALHEKGHFDFSDWFFDYLDELNKKVERGQIELVDAKEQSALRNIVEDARMEYLVTENNGFGEYIGAARTYLFANILKEWEKEKEEMDEDKISPRSMCMAIIFQYFRCPSVMPQDAKEYKLKGVCPFDYLQKHCGELRTSQDAIDVSNKVQALLNIFSGKKADDNDATPPPEIENKDILNKDQKKKAQEQRTADTRKQAVEEQGKQEVEKVNKEIKQSVENGNESREKKLRELLEKLKEAIKQEIQKIMQEQQGSFDVSNIGDKHVLSEEAPDEETQKAYISITSERMKIADEWGDGNINRRVITKCPKKGNLSKEDMKRLHEDSKDNIKKLKKNLIVRLAEVESKQYNLKSGRLSRRHLSTANINQRPFYEKTIDPAIGISLCLLLDESASMGYARQGGKNSRYGASEAYNALKSAYIISEAMKDIPNVDMFAYSHTTTGDYNKDCIIKKLINPKIKGCDSMSGYSTDRAGCNYDSKAIEVVGKEFRKDSLYEKKFMIVLSDGQPNGHQYGGQPAMEDVRKNVKALEKKGVTMIQIGIGDSVPDTMFKNFIKFDEKTLVKDLTKMIKKLILKASK